MDKPRLICLMGPTASGKTDLAIALAGELNCELVSVDSALVYREMDIGSAKPDYPHHLVDIRDPSQAYSVADFVTDANRLVDDIAARGRTPLLVGGTMLYFKAFLEGLSEMPAADSAVRAEIEQEAARDGWPELHRQLAAVDPEAAGRIHPNHSQRLSRALEVHRVSGIPMSQWQQGTAGPLPGQRFDICQLAICPAHREELHRRIALRFERMLEAGFEQEVQRLRDRGDLTDDLPAVRAVGYRQMWRYLDGDYAMDEAVQKAVAATRQLAKRQLTWLRKWSDLHWIYTDQDGNALENLENVTKTTATVGKSPLQLALKYL